MSLSILSVCNVIWYGKSCGANYHCRDSGYGGGEELVAFVSYSYRTFFNLYFAFLVFRQGDIGTNWYAVLTGSLDVKVSDTSNHQVKIQCSLKQASCKVTRNVMNSLKTRVMMAYFSLVFFFSIASMLMMLMFLSFVPFVL